MAVVRTIVEQTRHASKNDTVRVETWNNGNNNNDGIIIHNEQQVNDNEDYWHKKARLYMEESALRYGYGPALVRLGNDARRKEGEDDHSSASSSSSFVDRNRCMGWKYESPVRRLELILEIITNNGESISYVELAKHLYEEAGGRGSSEGLYNLGHILWDEDDFVSAMDAFHAAMTMDDSDALYFVAAQYLSYEEEDSVTSFLPKVYERYGPEYVSSTLRLDTNMTPPLSLANDLQRHGYVLLYHAVNKHGHGPATHHLALLCNQNGNVKEFCQLLSLAANGDNPDSLFLRGHCYYFGTDGHTRDMSLAFTDFIAAADGGSVDAMVSAGAMLHQGVRSDDGRTIIVHRDQQRAFELYQRAGELGSIEGWRNVVSCYATGEGVKKCIDTAKYIANTMLKDDR
jgi:TPR repeat protein